jgi:hypothetical protein|uniref:ORF40b n=1 Tax=Pinus thunbergii TaxID=3350 RepID=Q32954_PINTH|nr:ORF40b [Pinus thunbergii]
MNVEFPYQEKGSNRVPCNGSDSDTVSYRGEGENCFSPPSY